LPVFWRSVITLVKAAGLLPPERYLFLSIAFNTQDFPVQKREPLAHLEHVSTPGKVGESKLPILVSQFDARENAVMPITAGCDAARSSWSGRAPKINDGRNPLLPLQ
jgi:hypothetical protein